MNQPHIADLFPWYLNGTLSDSERRRVDRHVQECSACGEELAKERRIYEGMAVAPSIEYMPAPSLKRLQAAIDGQGATDARNEELTRSRAAVLPRRPRWRAAAAASIVAAAIVAIFLTATRWRELREPNYHTVTRPVTHPQGEVIRAVFAPTITLVDLQSILAEAQLRIISGPTEAGVYSLAATSPRATSLSLALLRKHAQVRFAESSEPGQPADSRDDVPRDSP